MPATPPRNPAIDPSPQESLPALTERQELILSLIVREYIRTGQPVGPKTLVEHFDLGISSVTVRNEMSALEEHDLVFAPHTSAGRVQKLSGSLPHPGLPHPRSALTRLAAPSPFGWRGGKPSVARLGGEANPERRRATAST